MQRIVLTKTTDDQLLNFLHFHNLNINLYILFQWQELYSNLKKLYDDYCASVEAGYEKLKGVDTDKEFSELVKPFTPTVQKAYWALRKGTVPSVKSYLSKLDGKRIEELLPPHKINTLPVRKTEGVQHENALELKEDDET